MKQTRRGNFFLWAAIIFAAGGVALLSGCKGNPTSAANVERAIPEPPSLVVKMAPEDLRNADPLIDERWREANWIALLAPWNTTRTTAPVKAAMLYDQSTLYVAFISQKQVETVARDSVAVFLDTSAAANGTETVQLQVDSRGKVSCTWIRSAAPPARRADGTPDLLHPMSKLPDMEVKGLEAKVGQGIAQGMAVWTTMLAIPLENLPPLLHVTAAPGMHWKVNLLRTVMIDEGDRSELLQSNLSPVYVGAQAVSPYRMADLQLGN